MSTWSVQGKTCVVTGANSGIGKQTAIALAQLGAKVVMVCRSPERGAAALEEVQAAATGKVELMLCDMASLTSIRAFATAFRTTHDRLDVLINNAGGMFDQRALTEDGYERTFAINHLGYFLVTAELLDLLKASAPSRIVSVSSTVHKYGNLDFDNLQGETKFTMFGAYKNSKLCNVAFTYALARRLEGSGVTANCLHPGSVGSNFGSTGSRFFRTLMKIGRPFLTSTKGGAKTSVYLATSPDVEGVSGKYFARCREKSSSRASHDEQAQEQLWQLSERLTQPDTDAGAVMANSASTTNT